MGRIIATNSAEKTYVGAPPGGRRPGGGSRVLQKLNVAFFATCADTGVSAGANAIDCQQDASLPARMPASGVLALPGLSISPLLFANLCFGATTIRRGRCGIRVHRCDCWRLLLRTSLESELSGRGAQDSSARMRRPKPRCVRRSPRGGIRAARGEAADRGSWERSDRSNRQLGNHVRSLFDTY